MHNIKTLCPLPWSSVELDAMGKIKPCCLAREAIQDNNSDVTVRTHTIEQAINSKYMQDLRTQFLEGKQPSTCSPCWNTEAAGQMSKRMHSINKIKDVQYTEDNIHPKFIDLKLGNICNIKCRICGGESSSKWVEENFKLYGDKQHKTMLIQNGSWPRTVEGIWQQLESQLDSIRYLEITGGEPFLIEQQFAFLQKAVDKGVAHNIEIHYNTNGTVYPEHAINNIWPHFKKVEVAFSIDDVNERFHYQRYPAVWDEVKDNIAKFNALRNTNPWLVTQICCTINKQNIYYLPEVVGYIDSTGVNFRHFNLLHGPLEFHIAHMNIEAKRACYNRIVDMLKDKPYYEADIVPILNFMSTIKEVNDTLFMKRINEIDAIRKQDFKETFNEVYTYFKDYDKTSN
jgi:MoaA/NifB/PqqE/SkfB family radical SAM enzyme